MLTICHNCSHAIPATAWGKKFCNRACYTAFRKDRWKLSFWKHFNKSEGCWNWLGYINKRTGSGSIYVNGKQLKAYRASWIIHFGQIPDGLFVCHHCDNPKCVNPHHLFIGTHSDNMRDMIAKGRQSKYWSSKTHCKHGHPFDAENTYIASRGKNTDKTLRQCKQCVRDRQRRLYKRKIDEMRKAAS